MEEGREGGKEGEGGKEIERRKRNYKGDNDIYILTK